MALPDDLNTVTVTGSFRSASGSALAGTITFTPTATLSDPTSTTVIPAFGVSYNLQGGSFTSDPLVATDNSDLEPQGWGYEVYVALQDIQPYSFTTLIPHEPSTVDLSALAPISATGIVSGGASGNYLPLQGGTETGPLVLDADPPLVVPGATAGQVLVSDGSGNFTPQAIAAGSANVIDGVTVSGTTVSGRTIVATGTTTATWQLPLQVDTTASDIQPLGASASAGSLTQAAAANHVHPATGLVTTSSLPLPVSDGGTGSATQNFVDLSSTQSIGGAKTFTGTVNVPTPTVSTQAVTKAYADAISLGLSGKYSAHVATVGTETFTIVSGTVTTISGTAVDGVSPSVGDYLLVKDAPAATGTGSAYSLEPGNGLYTVSGNTTNLTLARAADMSGANEPGGAYVFVTAGTANSGDGFVVTTPSTAGSFTYGSGSIQFTQFTSTGSITAGTGLTQSGSTISLATPVASASLPAATTSAQGAVQLDGTGSDIQALAGTAAAGSSGLAADAKHVHPSTGLVTSGASAGGDISGTYPTSLTVAKIQGTAISAPPGGTSEFLAGNGTWQVPSGTGSIAAGYTLVVAASNATAKVKAGADYVCTGTGDQSVINTAIGALPSAGGTILLSAGLFSINAPVSITASNISLEGTGVSTQIAVASGTNITYAVAVTGSGVVECKLRRFWVNGSATDTYGTGIHISTPWATTDTQHVVEDVYITNCPNNGFEVPVYLTGSTKSDTRVLLVNRVHAKACGGNGFYLAYPSTTDSVFTDCIADTCGDNGFYVGGANLWFTNCKAFYNGSSGTGNYGFYVVGYNNYFTGCQAQDNYYHGFYGDQTGDSTYGAFGCTFDNCTADNNGQHTASLAAGWYLNGVSQWQITGGIAMCRPYATGPWQDYGVWITGTGGHNTVSGVLFSDNQAAPMLDTSTGPTYTSGNNYSTGAPASAWGLLPSTLGSGDASVKAYGAQGNGQYLSNAAMTSSSAVITAPSGAPWASAQTGMRVIMYGAGSGGVHASGTISSIGSAGTSATLGSSITASFTASTTVSSGICVWGTNDTTAIQNAVTAAGTTGAGVYFPPGIYLMTSGIGATYGPRIYGAGPGATPTNAQAFTSGISNPNYGSTIVCDPSDSSSMFGSGYNFIELANLSIIWTASASTGRIFANIGQSNAPVRITGCRFEVNDPSGNGQVVGSTSVPSAESPFMEWRDCAFIQTSSTRQRPLIQLTSNSSGADANITFRQCQWYQTGTDHSQYYVDIEYQGSSSGGDGYAMQVAFRDCVLGRAWGGAVKMLGVQAPVFDNCGFWDLNDSGAPSVSSASNPGILYFGEYSGASPCRNIRILGCFKNRSWADGSHVWDIYCESTTRGVFIEDYATKPDSNTSGANLYIELNGCADVYLRGNQTASGSNPGTTVISGPSSTQIVQSAGAIQLAAGAADGYVLTSDASGNGTWQEPSGGGGSASVLTAAYGTAGETLNAGTYGAFLITLSGTPTFTFSGAVSGTETSFTLYLKQPATGGTFYTPVWPGSVQWQDSTPPALSAVNSAVDILVFTSPDGGTNWYGALAGANYA